MLHLYYLNNKNKNKIDLILKKRIFLNKILKNDKI